MLLSHTAASTACSAVHRARALQLLAPAAAAGHRQQFSTAWRSTAAPRLLHTSTSVPRAAAEDTGAEVEEAVSPVYECNLEETCSYVCYSCITGTVASATYIEGDQPWLKFVLNVPTPHHSGFTAWNVLATGECAQQARDYVQEGAYIQAGGNFLPPDSLVSSGYVNVLQVPAVYASNIGYFGPDAEDPAQHLQHTMLPEISKADLDAFIASGGQQAHAQLPQQPQRPPAGASAPAAAAGPAAAPIVAPGMPDTYQQAADEREVAWMSLFRDNHLWVDQRDTKRGKQPDFRLKTRGTEGVVDALWINDRRTPAWVKGNLQLLPGGKPYALPPFIPPEALSGTPTEQQWVQVFEAYNQFWDNRVSKKNPRGPDFSPKDREGGGPALWLSSRDTPQWVHDNLDALPAPPPPRY